MSRAQAEIIGITLLIGFVLVSAGAVFVVGSSVLSPLEAQSEHEQNIGEAQQLGHEIETLMRSSNGDADVALRDGYDVSEDGANVTITVDGDEQDPIQTGQLERDGVVYEGGLIVDDETGQVISSPPFELRDGSSHMQFPALESESGQFGGALEQTDVRTIDNPEERLEIEIESAYYEQWADQFDNADNVTTTDGKVVIIYDFSQPTATPYSLSMGSGEGMSFTQNEMPVADIYSYYTNPDEKRASAVVSAIVEDANAGQGTDAFDVYGEYHYEGQEPKDGNLNIWKDVNQSEDRQPNETSIDHPTPTEELLLDLDGNTYEEGEDLDGGIFVVNETMTIDEEVEVTDESILIVHGNLNLENLGKIIVEEPLDIHIHGDLELDPKTEINTPDTYKSEKISLFIEGDIYANGIPGSPPNTMETAEGPEITGTIYGTESTLEVTGKFTNYGALIIEDFGEHNQNNDALRVYYDESLQDRPTPYAVKGENIELPDQMKELQPNRHGFDIRISEFEAG